MSVHPVMRQNFAGKRHPIFYNIWDPIIPVWICTKKKWFEIHLHLAFEIKVKKECFWIRWIWSCKIASLNSQVGIWFHYTGLFWPNISWYHWYILRNTYSILGKTFSSTSFLSRQDSDSSIISDFEVKVFSLSSLKVKVNSCKMVIITTVSVNIWFLQSLTSVNIWRPATQTAPSMAIGLQKSYQQMVKGDGWLRFCLVQTFVCKNTVSNGQCKDNAKTTQR